MKRVFALLALLAWLGTLAILALLAIHHWPEALGAIVLNALSVTAAWLAVTGRALRRVLGAVVAVLALAGAIALLVMDGALLLLIAYVAAVVLALGATALALKPRGRAPEWRPLPAPGRPVLLINPWSG